MLISIVCRFGAILRREHSETSKPMRSFILDDTTLEKNGIAMGNISKVYDHVSGRCLLGFKLLLLAVSDGISTLPIDFSLHREKGKEGDFGLSEK